MPLRVRVQGLPKLLKKLNAEHLTEPERKEIIHEAGRFAHDFIGPLIPRAAEHHGPSAALASTLAARYGDWGARVAVDAFPGAFLEFGTQVSSGPRDRRRRTAAAWRAGTYRISPRRFMSKTIGRTRALMREQLIPKAVANIERRWRA